MKHKRTFLVLSLAVAVMLLSSACLWPAVSASSDLSTIVTQTWEALSRFSSQPSEESPASADESQAEEEIAPSATPTSGPPMIHVTVDTNCRSGPGVLYDYLGALLTGELAEVLARGSQPGFWVIENPDNAGTECWVGEQYAVIEGDTSGLPVRAQPPTPTPEEPAQTMGSISGYVYIDGNNNGQPGDPQDGALTGATVSLYQGPCPGLNKIHLTTTNNQGYYIFSDLPAAKYCVIRPNAAPLTMPVDYYINLASGETRQGVNFRFVP